MLMPLIKAITLAKKASRWMIGFAPSRHLASNKTANLSTIGLINSGRVLELCCGLRNSRAKLVKITSEVIPLVRSS